MLPRAWFVLLILVVAGCVTDVPAATDAPPVPDFPPLEHVQPLWTVATIDAVVTHDASAKAATSISTYAFENKYHEALTNLRFVSAGMRVTAITLDDGTPVAFSEDPIDTSSFGPAGPILLPFALYNVTMPEGGAPGTKTRLTVTAEGWEEIIFLGGGSVGGDAPAAELNAFVQLAIVPIAEARGTPWMNVTFTRSADWTYVLGAFPVGEATEAARTVTQTYEVQATAFVVYAAKGLNVIEENVSGVRVMTYYHPDMLVQAQTVHEIAKRTLHVIGSMLGPFPYPSLATVPAKLAGNAFSVPGLSVMGIEYFRGVAPIAPVQQGRAAPWIAGSASNEEVLIHEITHNWWGSQVAGNNSDPDQGLRDDYVTEGFTTYLAEIAFYDIVYGAPDAAASVEAKWKGQDEKRRDGTNGPITGPRGDHYEQAALAMRVLHGHFLAAEKEAAFFQTFRDMLTTYRIDAGGTGVIRHEEVVRAFSTSYGEDLTTFFATWFETTDLPDIAIDAVNGDTATITNRGAVRVPVEVRFRDALGAQTTRTTWLDAGASETLASGLAAPLVQVVADPAWRLDESVKTNNVWGAAAPIASPLPSIART